MQDSNTDWSSAKTLTLKIIQCICIEIPKNFNRNPSVVKSDFEVGKKYVCHKETKEDGSLDGFLVFIEKKGLVECDHKCFGNEEDYKLMLVKERLELNNKNDG